MFIDFYHKEHNHITFGDNNNGKTLGEGIVKNSSTITIDGVLLVK